MMNGMTKKIFSVFLVVDVREGVQQVPEVLEISLNRFSVKN